MKKPVSLRLDEALIERVRERVGPRGMTELVESLLVGWLDPRPIEMMREFSQSEMEAMAEGLSGGGPNREEGRPASGESRPPRSQVQSPPDNHEHIWSKHRGDSGLVFLKCQCGVIA